MAILLLSLQGNFIDASAHISTIMTALTQGPLDATFNVYADFDDYTGGVYQHLYGTYEGMHSVKVIGWGVEDDEDYWLVQVFTLVQLLL